jgi:hypothetical protein
MIWIRVGEELIGKGVDIGGRNVFRRLRRTAQFRE